MDNMISVPDAVEAAFPDRFLIRKPLSGFPDQGISVSRTLEVGVTGLLASLEWLAKEHPDHVMFGRWFIWVWFWFDFEIVGSIRRLGILDFTRKTKTPPAFEAGGVLENTDDRFDRELPACLLEGKWMSGAAMAPHPLQAVPGHKACPGGIHIHALKPPERFGLIGRCVC